MKKALASLDADAARRARRPQPLRRRRDARAQVDARRCARRAGFRGAHADEHRGQPRRSRRAGPGRAAQRDAGDRARRAQPARARRLPRTPSGGAHPGQDRGAAAANEPSIRLHAPLRSPLARRLRVVAAVALLHAERAADADATATAGRCRSSSDRSSIPARRRPARDRRHASATTRCGSTSSTAGPRRWPTTSPSRSSRTSTAAARHAARRRCSRRRRRSTPTSAWRSKCSDSSPFPASSALVDAVWTRAPRQGRRVGQRRGRRCAKTSADTQLRRAGRRAQPGGRPPEPATSPARTRIAPRARLFSRALITGILDCRAAPPPCATFFDTRQAIRRLAWAGLAADRRRAAGAAVGAGLGGHRVGAHHQPRDPLRVPGARAQHRRRLRGTARPRLHRVLRGRRVRLCAAREPAFQPAPAVLDDPADGRGGRVHVRRAARRADAEAARRLPRDRHAGLRRDHPHLPQQPVAAGQHHQRAAGHHADRPVPHRRFQLRQARDDPGPRFHGPDQVLLLLPGA